MFKQTQPPILLAFIMLYCTLKDQSKNTVVVKSLK
jgi:hypothetical protein